MLPVPLNSSKITSSMRLPVSIKAVATMVSEPPSSMLRAAPKKRFGRCKCVRIHTAREHFARRRNHGVVRTRQTRDRIEQDHHVALMFHQALGFFDHHLGDLHVTRSRLVEGRADHFAAHRTLHVRDFFRAFVDQQHDQVHFRVIGRDGVRDALQQHRFTGARRRDDQPALALSRWASTDPSRVPSSYREPVSSFRRSSGYSGVRLSKKILLRDSSGGSKLIASTLIKCEVALALFGRTDLARNCVASA